MPGIDREISQHIILLIQGMKLVEQKLCRMKLDVALKIKEEVIKQLNAGFIRVAYFPCWIVNFVHVPKNNGRLTCVLSIETSTK